MADLILYTNPQSRGRIVRWMLEEIGQPYRTELLEYGTTMKAPEYLAINPMGKVPAIRHGDVVVPGGAGGVAPPDVAEPPGELPLDGGGGLEELGRDAEGIPGGVAEDRAAGAGGEGEFGVRRGDQGTAPCGGAGE